MLAKARAPTVGWEERCCEPVRRQTLTSPGLGVCSSAQPCGPAKAKRTLHASLHRCILSDPHPRMLATTMLALLLPLHAASEAAGRARVRPTPPRNEVKLQFGGRINDPTSSINRSYSSADGRAQSINTINSKEIQIKTWRTPVPELRFPKGRLNRRTRDPVFRSLSFWSR